MFPIIDTKITLLHKSTKDFLKERNNSLKYYVSETIASKNISYYLISLVKEEKYNDYIFKNFITHLLDAKLYSEVSYYLSLDEFNNKWLDRIDRFKYLDSYITSLLRLGNEDLSYYKVVINSNYFINLVKQYYSFFSITDIFYKLHSYHELTFFKDLDSKEVNQIDHVLLISFAFYYNNIRQYSKVREFLQPYVYNKELIHNLLGDNTRYLNEYYYELLSQYVTSLYYLIEYDEIMNIYNELLDKSSTFLDMPSKCVILSIVAKVELCLGNHTKSNELFNQVIDCFKESIRTSSYTNQFINRIYYKNILRELLIIKIALNDIDESINIEKEFKNITIQNNSIIYENINQKAEIAKMLYNALNHEDVKNDYEYLINSSLTTFDKAVVTIVYNISLMLNDKLEEVYYKYTLEKYVTREDYLLHALYNMVLSSFGIAIEYNYSNDALKKYERLDNFINYLKEVLFSKILEKDENII